MTNDELNKPRQFWLDITTPYGDPCDFIREGKPHEQPCATNIHVIEVAPMLKMMESLAEANEKLMIETYCLMTQVRYPKRLENLTKDDGSVAFAYHNAREILESYQSFKRENGLE